MCAIEQDTFMIAISLYIYMCIDHVAVSNSADGD